MDNLILFDDPGIRGSLLPFTFTRPVADIRVGILKIREKWQKYTRSEPGFLTQDYLQEKFPLHSLRGLLVNGAVCPNPALWKAMVNLDVDEALWFQNTLLATFSGDSTDFQTDQAKEKKPIYFESEVTLIKKVWNIFEYNAAEIKKDFQLLTEGRESGIISDSHTITYNRDRIFLEEGVKIKAAVLNAENGPIYLGKNAEVQEGALIRGPFALCEGSTVNMGAKMRGDTTVGPFSKVGGEISNTVIFGHSNKGHEGFMGNSVIGEWCNFGADTNVSNLKNNYSPVKLWDYLKGDFSDTGLQFCGLMMADHAKCGINTMFNTGTVVGVGANIFGGGYPKKFIPSFAWGGATGFSTFQLKKFDETATAVMNRRGLKFGPAEKEITKKVFELTRHYRIWDKEV